MALQVSEKPPLSCIAHSNLKIYDFFQTLELEVEHIWMSALTPFKLLYIFMKYLPFIDVSLLIIRRCFSGFRVT